MDAKERLSLEEISEHSLIACEHLHRYEIAAELTSGLRVLDLCCGAGYGSAVMAAGGATVHGVDIDVATVDVAAATVGRDTGATFEARDALSFLREENIAARFDAIVCFEGLEHVPDVEAVFEELRHCAEAGVQLVVSMPNSKAFEEDNEFHLTNFGLEEVRAAAARFDGALILYQHLAEGSVVLAEGAEELESRLVHADQGEPEFANHFIVAVGFDPDAVREAQRVRAQLIVAPVYNRYMRSLELANTQLRRRNAQLARGLIGRADSGAASFVSGLEQRVAELEVELAATAGQLAASPQPQRRLGARLRRLLR
jgi:2-polyprenyl-3-methyl-5-hydroxy-6-metoxy-1,4-benzoquinol methylase